MRKIPHFLKKIPIFSSNWGSEIGSKYANFSDFWALLPDPETTSLSPDDPFSEGPEDGVRGPLEMTPGVGRDKSGRFSKKVVV